MLPEDLLKFGLIPEFVGRLPMIGAVRSLDREALIQILIEPKNALVKQYRKFFEFEDVELEFTHDALEAIADQALLRGTGARGLRAILEEVLLNTMYDLPGRTDVGQVRDRRGHGAREGQPDAGAARAGAPSGRAARPADAPDRTLNYAEALAYLDAHATLRQDRARSSRRRSSGSAADRRGDGRPAARPTR